MPQETFSVEIKSKTDGGYEIYVGSDNGSGTRYYARNWAEVSKNIEAYINMYVKENLEEKENG